LHNGLVQIFQKSIKPKEFKNYSGSSRSPGVMKWHEYMILAVKEDVD
jgi:hypothetical protein